MRMVRTIVLGGAATLLLAGAAYAATSNFHTMKVDMPDGETVSIRYAGDVAPKVEVQPVDARDLATADPFALAAFPGFADFDRISALMEQQSRAMMQHVAEMQAAMARGAPNQVLVSGNMPAGTTVHYTYVSTMNGKNACTQTVEYTSDGSGVQPKVTRTSAGDCGAVKEGEGDKPAPASATVQQPAAPAPGKAV